MELIPSPRQIKTFIKLA